VTLNELKERAVVAALARHGGSKVQAAAELGVSLKTIYNVLARIRLRPSADDAGEHEPVRPEPVSPES